jgi:phospholipid/cholesterol/gamma-HCH transport system substrate-binding protein
MRRLVGIAIALAAGVLALFGTAAGGDSGSYEVRAIFDSADFLVTGENVRVAGATVGSVGDVEVSMPGEPVHADGSAEPGKAIVVLKIDDPGFRDFRSDASCIIRPQSLLGEKFVNCEPTQPRAPDQKAPPLIQRIPEGQPGAGQYLLPLENNGNAVDLDLVQNINREPFIQRFRLILNDLGAGLAARGKDLDAIIRRADPALRETDQVLAILAHQNHELANLARDSDTVVAPLARERRHVSGFLANAGATAQATAERSQDLETDIQRFPPFLRELRGTMHELDNFATQGTPLATDLNAAAPSITRTTEALGPFAKGGTLALTSLGKAAQGSGSHIVASDPVIKQLRDLARSGKPVTAELARLLVSLRQTGGTRKLMDFIYNSAGSVNGFDASGHFLRTLLQVTACTDYVTITQSGCSANWRHSAGKLLSLNDARKLFAAPAQRAGPKPSGNRKPEHPAVPSGATLDANGDAAAGSSPLRASGGGRHASATEGRRASRAASTLFDYAIGRQGQR